MEKKSGINNIFALLVLVVPMLMKLQGFEIAQGFSMYPLYG
jgi:hypothetical protein